MGANILRIKTPYWLEITLVIQGNHFEVVFDSLGTFQIRSSLPPLIGTNVSVWKGLLKIRSSLPPLIGTNVSVWKGLLKLQGSNFRFHVQ